MKKQKKELKQCIVALFLLISLSPIQAQEKETYESTKPMWSIKTNLLYDATATMNLGLELQTGRKTSFELSGNWNPFTFSNNRKWKHVLVQPEFRYWTKKSFAGHFFGLHAHYAYYNVGNLPKPFSENMRDNRYEGWGAGAGLSYGYRWNFNHRWGLETTIGVGYAYLDYKKFECGNCGRELGQNTKNYFGPTKAGISLIYTIGSKAKTKIIPHITPLQPPTPIEQVIYIPQFAVSFVTPEIEPIKQRSQFGKAYLDFAAGQSTIVPNFNNNAAELEKIQELIVALKNDPYATITRITITGYASPEGTFQTNLLLSEKRATALKQYIAKINNLPERLFAAKGAGEDWSALDSLIENSTGYDDKDVILSIIRNTGVFEGREKKLMDLSAGVPYRQMYNTLFPLLRRCEYELHYQVLPFELEKGKEMFKTQPSHLSLNEMFAVANSYGAGTDAFYDAFETAARIFPNNDLANLNAAAGALNREDTRLATLYLSKVSVRSAAYWNNAAILAFLEKDYDSALTYFEKANAKENLEELKKYLIAINPPQTLQ